MEYKNKNYSKGVEETYEVTYDEDMVKNLIDRIIKDTSFKEARHQYSLPAEGIKYDFFNKKIVSGLEMINGDCKYADIEELQVIPDEWGYDSIISFSGREIHYPYLAEILYGILQGGSLNYFLNYLFSYYEDSLDLMTIDEIINKYKAEFDEISEDDCNGKINALEQLISCYKNKKDSQYFNSELLKKYYEEAKSLIGIKLVNEKVLEKRN